ncbi:MAG: hypothetical protein BA873_01975 [Desulfobulbaceae bacterium C00003063]|nr:MAG: hypothetical protein BA873_01975 [Desulfobulbaceae bacterium C00003063]
MNFDTFKQLVTRITQTESTLRSVEMAYRFTYPRKSMRMAQAIKRFKECDIKKPRSRIKQEMSLCKKFWGCYPLHYYRYDLYKKEKELSETEILNYIPEFFFYYLFLPYYDSTKYTILLTDKNITEQLFRSLVIRQAHTICKLINGRLYTNKLVETNFSRIEKELEEKNYQKIFVKPLDGQGGYGIYIFHNKDNGKYITKYKDVLTEDFLRKIAVKKDYIVQPGLIQDPEISRIYPHSVNTFRIATENKNGDVRILCATLRLGRGGNEVDNSAQDGIITKVDVETGRIGNLATSEQCEYFEKHPDTRFVFKKNRISNWNKVKQFAICSAKKMPQFTYLGWDIALTQEGPLAVETNLKFGLDHYQVALGGLREIFQISDPKFYWKNREKRV